MFFTKAAIAAGNFNNVHGALILRNGGGRFFVFNTKEIAYGDTKNFTENQQGLIVGLTFSCFVLRYGALGKPKHTAKLFHCKITGLSKLSDSILHNL